MVFFNLVFENKSVFGLNVVKVITNVDEIFSVLNLVGENYDRVVNAPNRFIVLISENNFGFERYLPTNKSAYISDKDSTFTGSLSKPIRDKLKLFTVNHSCELKINVCGKLKHLSIDAIPNVLLIPIHDIINCNTTILNILTNEERLQLSKLFGNRILNSTNTDAVIPIKETTTITNKILNTLTIIISNTCNIDFINCTIKELIIERNDFSNKTIIHNVRSGIIKVIINDEIKHQYNTFIRSNNSLRIKHQLDLSELQCTKIISVLVDTEFIVPQKLESMDMSVNAITIKNSKLTITNSLTIKNSSNSDILNLEMLDVVKGAKIDIKINSLLNDGRNFNIELDKKLKSIDLTSIANNPNANLSIKSNIIEKIIINGKELNNNDIKLMMANSNINFGNSSLPYDAVKDYCYGERILNSNRTIKDMTIDDKYDSNKAQIKHKKYESLTVTKDLDELILIDCTIINLILCSTIKHLTLNNCKIDNLTSNKTFECKNLNISQCKIDDSKGFIINPDLNQLSLSQLITRQDNELETINEAISLDYLYYIINNGCLTDLTLENVICNFARQLDVSSINNVRLVKCYIEHIKINKTQTVNTKNTLIKTISN